MIEMLLENPFIVIILIGLISSMLGKSKGEEKQNVPSGNNRQRLEREPEQHSEKPSHPLFDLFFDEDEDYEGKKEQDKKQTVFEDMATTMEKQAQMLAQAAKIEEAEANKHRRSSEELSLHGRMERNRHKAKPLHDDSSITSSQSRLVEGIILSEILGKPRAKNPHSSRRF